MSDPLQEIADSENTAQNTGRPNLMEAALTKTFLSEAFVDSSQSAIAPASFSSITVTSAMGP